MGARSLVLLLSMMALTVLSLYHGQYAGARTLSASTDKEAMELGAPYGTIKTIEDLEYGVLIDCIDIYKQPALQNPLLKDHVIQMEPSTSLPSFPARQEEEEEGNSKKEVLLSAGQGWLKYGQCPKGTIPIIRTHKRLGGEADKVDLPLDVMPIYKQQWL